MRIHWLVIATAALFLAAGCACKKEEEKKEETKKEEPKAGAELKKADEAPAAEEKAEEAPAVEEKAEEPKAEEAPVAEEKAEEPKAEEAPAEEPKEVATESGLKYIDLKVGDGASPEAGKMVTVHYTGWLENGTKFDSSVDRGQPFVFPIGMGRVIRGWDEGVMSMKIGGKRKLIIPAELGYGARGAGGVIPPNATLIFEVELLGIGG